MKRVISRMATLFKGIQITLPTAIVIGAVVFSISFYSVQVNKSKSIESQKQEDVAIDQQNRLLQVKRSECEALTSGLKNQWNNVVGVTYREGFWEYDDGECWVTYKDTKTGAIETAPLSSMEDVK